MPNVVGLVEPTVDLSNIGGTARYLYNKWLALIYTNRDIFRWKLLKACILNQFSWLPYGFGQKKQIIGFFLSKHLASFCKIFDILHLHDYTILITEIKYWVIHISGPKGCHYGFFFCLGKIYISRGGLQITCKRKTPSNLRETYFLNLLGVPNLGFII